MVFTPGFVHAQWTQRTKLIPNDAGAFDNFGTSVGIDGDTVVVGSPYAGPGNQGAAFVFVRNGSVWSQQAELMANDAATSDAFGLAVAISGNTIAVGAYTDDDAAGTNQGSAYVFVRAGTAWSQQAKLLASDAAANDLFGTSIAIDGDTVVVGARHADVPPGNNNDGAAYVFIRTGTTWSQQAKLTANDSAVADEFGGAVAVSGNTAIVTSQLDNGPAGEDQGSAYVFVRSGTVWSQQAKLTNTDAAAFDYLGSAVALDGETALVGALLKNGPGGFAQGAAYVFVRSGTVWSQQAKLLASDGADCDFFGNAVGLDGDTAIIGAYFDSAAAGLYQGSAYVFTRSGTVWTQQAKLLASDAAPDDEFGTSVAVQNGTAIIGAATDTGMAGNQQGSAYIFTAPTCLLGDANGDNQVNLADFATMANCLAGPGQPIGAGCGCVNFDADSDIDLQDVGAFQSAFAP